MAWEYSKQIFGFKNSTGRGLQQNLCKKILIDSEEAYSLCKVIQDFSYQ